MALKDQLFISVTKISPIFSYLEQHAVTKKDLLSELGLGTEVFEAPDNKISLAQVDNILLTAQRLIRDDYIGLHVGEMITKGFSSILGHILMNCATLHEALEKYCTYERLVDDTTRTTFYNEGNYTIIESTIEDTTVGSLRQLAEYKISGIRAYAALLVEKQLRVSRVEFVHAAPKDVHEYERVFHSRVLFNQRRNALIVESEDLLLPIREPNRELLSAFEAYAASMLNSLLLEDSFRKKTSEVIVHTLNGKLPTIETIAERLAVSVRTLQMRLNNEGTSFRRLLDDIRKNMAFRYLQDRTATIGEIAYLLGFSEASAFHRTFKRWTGQTPREYRSHHHSA